MKVLIINGSPLRNGNTTEVLKPFIARLSGLGADIETIFLNDYKVLPCLECRACQNTPDAYGCPREDDVCELMDHIAACDLLVLATPIYTWYCTPEMKALMDRHYMLNKFYGSAPRQQLIPRLSIALLTTNGYEDDYANEPFETGVMRWCRHCGWDYAGRYSVRDIDGICDMQTPEAIEGARHFAEQLVARFDVSRETYEAGQADEK